MKSNSSILLGNLNRSSTSQDGYTRFQISRETLEALKSEIQKDPNAAIELLNVCIKIRGKDNRKKNK